jgi:hypothetical protein
MCNTNTTIFNIETTTCIGMQLARKHSPRHGTTEFPKRKKTHNKSVAGQLEIEPPSATFNRDFGCAKTK